MTTARALLRRLITRRRIDQRARGAGPGTDQAEDRLEAARQRLKQAIPSPEEPAEAGEETNQIPGQTTPSSEGVSPGQESPPVP